MPAPTPEPKRRIKIVNDYKPGDVAITVGADSEFGTAIKRMIAERRPTRIIETGTYEGKGTTLAIVNGLRKAGLTARFYTIECNFVHYARALRNLAQAGALGTVTPLHGLSVPRRFLPTIEQIQKWCVEDVEFDDIFIDHYEVDRAQRYYLETNFDHVPDNLLGTCLGVFENQPDFVLLDSGGHMGNVEFNYLIEVLEKPCIIALDDIHHIKHHRSYRQIKSDRRFRLLSESREKFGSCIAEFTPVPSVPKHILWMRSDAVGDTIWAMGMLPHLRRRYPKSRITVLCLDAMQELYQDNPHIDGTLLIDRHAAETDANYLPAFSQFLRQQKFDLVLNSVFSRSVYMDLLAHATESRRIIGYDCHLNNILLEAKAQTDFFYTKLIPQRLPYEHETERHKDFLHGIGIEADRCEPELNLTKKDEDDAARLYKDNGLDPARTVVLAAGVGRGHRLYPHYGRAIGPICRELGLKVALLGTPADREIIGLNRLAIADIAVDLTGEDDARQAAAFVKRCRIVVGAETGTATMASALKVPNVVLLGGGDFGRFLPYRPTDAAACLPLACHNCGWQCRYGVHHCVVDVAPEVLAEAFRRTLEGTGEKPRFFIQAADRFVTTPEGPTWKQPEGWPQHCEAEFITVTPPLARWDKAQELAWLSNVPDEIKHVYKIREQLLQQDHWSKMQRILLKGSETLPNPPVLAYLYAQSLASENRLGEAADFLRSKIASGADAATLPLAYLLTELLIEASAPTEALEVARKALERHPDDRWLRANVDIVNGTPLRLKKIPVILLAGGFGTRLSSVVSDRPKCLAEVCGHPFLHYILEQISASGCERLFISVHHLADQIRRAIGPRHRGMAVAYVEEPKPLGTGGAIRLAMEAFPDETFLVMNADSFLDINLADLADPPPQEGDSRLAAVSLESCLRFGKLRFADGDRIEGFEEKSTVDGPGWINAGIYLLPRDAFADFPAGTAFSIENDLFPRLAKEKKLHGKQFTRRFIDIGTPSSYEEAQTFFKPMAGELDRRTGRL